MPKVKNQRYRFLSIDEANMLITCLSNRKFFSSMLWRDFTVLSMNTGIRPNELFNLRRCHISLKNKIIYTGNGKIDNGYVRFNQRISEVDEMRNFVPQEDDEIIERDGVTFLVDSLSMQYLVGAEIDFKEDLEGSQFVIRNPNAVTSCSCGSSFSV